MIWFLACSALALFLTAGSIVNLFRDRFPHPADIATISISYYGVPLAIAGYFDLNYDHLVFLANFAADQDLAALSMRYIVLALVALRVGQILGRQLVEPTLTRFGIINTIAFERLRFGFCALIGLIVIGIYLFGLQEFLAGYATEGLDTTGSTGNAVVYATLEFMGLAIAYALIIGLSTGRIPFKLLIAMCLAVMLAILAIRAKRLEIISAFIPPAVILLAGRKVTGTLSWRVIAGGLGITLLVIVSALRTSADISLPQSVFFLFSEGLYAGHSLPGIVERLQTQLLDYEHGARFINALIGFVPRFLWEGKDDMIYAGNLALKGVAPLGATSFLAEVVLQGGAVAIILCYTVMGFTFERITKFQNAWDASISLGVVPARVGAYLISVAIFIPHFRDGIIPAIKLSLQAAAFFALISGMRLLGRVRITAVPGTDDTRRDGVAA